MLREFLSANPVSALLVLVFLSVFAAMLVGWLLSIHEQPSPELRILPPEPAVWMTVTQAMELLNESRQEILLRISFDEITLDERSATTRLLRSSVERVLTMKRRVAQSRR